MYAESTRCSTSIDYVEVVAQMCVRIASSPGAMMIGTRAVVQRLSFPIRQYVRVTHTLPLTRGRNLDTKPLCRGYRYECMLMQPFALRPSNARATIPPPSAMALLLLSEQVQNSFEVLARGDTTTTGMFTIPPYEILPQSPSYTHYMGSLTTPPCSEVSFLPTEISQSENK